MDQIKVNIVGVQALELLLKHRLIIGVCHYVEFCGKIVAFSGIFGYGFSQKLFGVSVVIHVSSIVIIYSMLHSII